jgi:hypothetical protein
MPRRSVVSALQVDRDAEQAGGAPRRHRGYAFAGVARGIERPVGVGEVMARGRVQVVEDRLHHARVQQQPLDADAFEAPPRVGRPPVDQEPLALDVDGGGAGWNVGHLGRLFWSCDHSKRWRP